MNTINDVPKELQVDLKTKTVIVYDNGLFVEIAKTLSKSFKKVYYYCPWKSAFPKSNQYVIGDGIEGIERVWEFWDYVDKVDLFCFLDVYDGDIQEHLVSIGKNVWGSRKGEEMELYRNDMKEYMKEVGLYATPFKVIKGVAALREYLTKNENVYVKINMLRGNFETFKSENYELSEPRLDEIEFVLGALKTEQEFIVENAYDNAVETGVDMYTIDGRFPSSTLAGIEIKDEGYVGKIVPYEKLSEKLTDFNDKMKTAFNRYNYRGFFSTEIRISKDRKPYMVDFCFSDDTEVLTEKGWKLFKDCIAEDKFATMNTGNKNIEYQHATDYICYDYNGQMISLSNAKKSIEGLITPNHLVLRYDRHKKRLFKERADSLTDKGFIPRTGIWEGNNEEYFELPEYHKEWDWVSNRKQYFNRKTKELVPLNEKPYLICTKTKHDEPVKIKMKDWAAFLGWYISEGSTSNKYVTQIAQVKNCEQVKEVLDRLPFKYSYNNKSFRISSVQLTLALKQFGLCDKKFVPDCIKQSSKEVIREFLDNFNLGDGSIHGGNKVYYTTSKQLADDLQECIFKVGSVANIIFEENHNKYTIYERNKFTDYWFETGCRKEKYINRVDYNGKVYCVTVPNGTLYVRRKGKPFWSSNCSRAGSPPSELYQLLYKNLAEIIWYGAQGFLIDPITEYKYGVEVLIHSAWADKNWQAVSFPSKYRDNIKLRNACKIDGKFYCVPQVVGLPEIGAIVAEGNTLNEAISKVKEIAETVKGYYIDIKLNAIDAAHEEFKKLEEFDVKIL